MYQMTIWHVLLTIAGVLSIFAVSFFAAYLMDLYDMEWVRCWPLKKNLKHFISMIGR
jgi:hypothetical protein